MQFVGSIVELRARDISHFSMSMLRIIKIIAENRRKTFRDFFKKKNTIKQFKSRVIFPTIKFVCAVIHFSWSLSFIFITNINSSKKINQINYDKRHFCNHQTSKTIPTSRDSTRPQATTASQNKPENRIRTSKAPLS